jgi:hypothetical protein
LRICWLLLLEEYGVTFEYLPGNKNVGIVADSISLSGSENNSISNIKFPMHTALIFKEKAKVK